MRSLSKNLVKFNNVVVKEEGKRIIDSNTLVAEKIQSLTALLEEENSSESFAEGFTAGLNADQVEQLLADPEKVEMDTQQAGEVIKNANEEAEQIIASAQAEADSILLTAKGDAAKVKADAIRTGHDEGYQVGFDEGLKKASKAEETYRAKQQQLEEAYEKKLEEIEPQFIEVLTGIYSHIFHIDLSSKKELVLYLLKDTIRNIEGGKNFLVHVSKDDYALVNEHKQELLAGIGSTNMVEIIEDLTLPTMQCFVETEGGIFDCSLGTELELLEKELKLLSYTKD